MHLLLLWRILQVYVDALRNEDCLARYLNDCRHKCGYNVRSAILAYQTMAGMHVLNTDSVRLPCAFTRFDKKPEEGCADVVAIRDVYPGEELYVDYGRWYWAGGDGSSLPLRDMLWRQMQCKEQYLQERQSPEAEDAEGTVR